MDILERIENLCRQKNIYISTLEKDLGFGNGSLRKAKSIKADRLQKIATYLNVSEEYLMTGQESEKESDTGRKYYFSDETAQAAQQMFENKELRVLFDVAHDMDVEDLQAMYNMALALKRKERGSDD